MVIHLESNERHNLHYNLRKFFLSKTKKISIDDKDLCKMINVSPVTFSRQINSNRFDSAFLHKYLIASQVIPESVTMPIYDRLQAFISAYPIEYQKSIKSFFTKS